MNLSVLFPLNNIKKMLIHIIAQSITAAIFIIAAAISAAK
ncbi:putative membrane protein [Wolbachia pipientis wVitA]|nr:putative membrane protein [Wolbachia pipientis wVitA]